MIARRPLALVQAVFRLVLPIALMLTCAGRGFAQASIAQMVVAEQGDGYELRYVYPKIGIPSADAAMQDWVHAQADGFRGVLSDRGAQEPPYSAQLTYAVARNDEAVVSILFSYSIYTGGAHPNSTQTAFNFLVPDGARVFLPDMVGSDGIQRVSDLAIADLTRQLTGPDALSDATWIHTGAAPFADNFETFELLPDQIVIEFDPYAVAAYAAGPQKVRIPLTELQDLLRPDPRAPLPSFDCADARTRVERAICADMALAQLDRRTAEAFDMRLRFEAQGNQQPTVRAQQQAWLAERDGACASSADSALVTCLAQQYASRLIALQNFR